MQDIRDHDAEPILVVGTGPAGLAAALGIARLGLRAILVGPDARTDDRRTTALMLPALDLLAGFGVLDALSPHAAPLRSMRIVDATARLIRSPPVTFHAAEIGEDHFGLNVPNAALNEVLQAAVDTEPGIERRRAQVAGWSLAADRAAAALDDGVTVEAKLVVAADGRLSAAREAAGIRTSTRWLPQAALVASFAHGRDHGFVSTEFHTETGPFTQVPLPGRRSSLVWVTRPEEADELLAMDDATLSRRIEDRMQSMLGRVMVEPGRQVYPLSATLPSRFAASRTSLVGEAAHVFPPIGAQGLNLGLRDVREVLSVIDRDRADPGAPSALAAYDRARRPDILARAGAVNLLNASLLSDMLPAQIARGTGLGLLGLLGPLRAFFMREGLSPGSGFAVLGARLREQVRRQ